MTSSILNIIQTRKRTGKRPGLPDDYEEVLKQGRLSTPITGDAIISVREGSAALSGYGPSAEWSPVKCSAPRSDQEQFKEDEASNLVASETFGGVIAITPPATSDDLRRETTGSSSTKAPQKTKSSAKNTSLATKYIKANGLECSKSTAEEVAKYLEPFQRAYDLDASKLKLSNLIGNNGKVKGAIKYHINCIQYVPRVEIEAKDQAERCGKPMLDGVPADVDEAGVESTRHWLEFTGKEISNAKYPSEIQVEQAIGRLMQGFFASQNLRQTS